MNAIMSRPITQDELEKALPLLVQSRVLVVVETYDGPAYLGVLVQKSDGGLSVRTGRTGNPPTIYPDEIAAVTIAPFHPDVEVVV